MSPGARVNARLATTQHPTPITHRPTRASAFFVILCFKVCRHARRSRQPYVHVSRGHMYVHPHLLHPHLHPHPSATSTHIDTHTHTCARAPPLPPPPVLLGFVWILAVEAPGMVLQWPPPRCTSVCCCLASAMLARLMPLLVPVLAYADLC